MMLEEIDDMIERLKALAERMPTTGDMADIDMAILYVRHARRRVENREETNDQ
jgi:hypothetical protein